MKSSLIFFGLIAGLLMDHGVGLCCPARTAKVFAGDVAAPLPVRTALVIGVAGLKEGNGFRDLKNPANDAAAVAEALCDLGFETTDLASVLDGKVTRQSIKAAMYDMGITLKKRGGVGLVYFAGHGLQHGKETYLVPYDALVRFEQDIAEELLSLSFVFSVLQYSDNPLNIVIIDSCRDDPWQNALPTLGVPLRDVMTVQPRNVLLEASTLSGLPARDGSTDMSPFARAFVDNLKIARSDGMDLGAVFGAVNADVALNPVLSEAEMPVFGATGRSFVFAPTRSTFLLEKAAYDNAAAAESGPGLQRLMYLYNAGYFYQNAKAWLANPPTRQGTAIPAAPLGTDAAKHATLPFDLGSASGLTANLTISDVLSVSRVWPRTTIAARSPFIPAQAPERSITIAFTPSGPAGLDEIDGASRQAFLSAFAAARATDVAVVLHRYGPPDGRNDLRGLLRQMQVLKVMHDAGVDTAATPLRTMASADTGSDLTVTVTYRPLSLPTGSDLMAVTAGLKAATALTVGVPKPFNFFH